jgi:CheY-like chemotaxis protein
MTQPDLSALNPRILVADDEPINLKVMQRLLKHCGLNCEVASDGAECVAKAESGDYDVILMDINMPNMDGIDATREISRMLAPGGPKIIAVTASVSNMQKKECDEVGFAGFIPKPVRINTLVEVLTENLH